MCVYEQIIMSWSIYVKKDFWTFLHDCVPIFKMVSNEKYSNA